MANRSADIDQQKLKALMRLKPSLEDAAAFFECSTRTIERYITRKFKITFTEFREQHMVHTRLNIVRKAIQKAESGDNVMLIFCLKNLCGWKDRHDSEAPKVTINNLSEVTKIDLEERVAQLKGEGEK